MAIKVGGTEVITNSRELSNIASIDAATVTALEAVISTDSTLGTLTKSFSSGESATVTLSSTVSPTAVVAVTKEVGQTGVSSKGAWDVASDAGNYELYNEAPATSLSFSASSDISTASYSQNFSVSAQDTYPSALHFKSDGTKMYVVGGVGVDVNEYNLSTAWDVSTASYGQNFSVSAQEIAPEGIFFKTDGTKMYIAGHSGDDVNEYNLSTAWDISTASFLQAFSVAAQETLLRDVAFSVDGTKMYILGNIGEDVNEYDLSTAWDVSTASYSQSFSHSGQSTDSDSLFFKSDGTKMYILDSGDRDVNEYDLSTAWDVSTATYSTQFTGLSNSGERGMFFKSDGTKMYVTGNTDQNVKEYDVPVSLFATLGTGSFSSSDVGKRIFVDDGGEALLTATDGSYSLVTAFGASSYTSGNWSLSGLDVDATDGVTISGATSGFFDLSTKSYDDISFDTTAQDSSLEDVYFKPDGTAMFIIGGANDTVYQYTLSTAWDVSSASYSGKSFSVGTQDSSPRGIFFRNDTGTRMYIVGDQNNRIYEYSLSSWDVSTASLLRNFYVGSQESSPKGIYIRDNGGTMFIVGTTGDAVYEYNIGTWNLSSGSFVRSFSVSSQDSNPGGVSFSSDGTRMFICGDSTNNVYEYSLSSAWNISTASLVTSSGTSPSSNVTGIFFKPQGDKMYLTDWSTDKVYQYSIGSVSQPTAQYFPAITSASGQIESQYWTDINSMTADDADGDGEVYYAVSTDDRTTWSVAKASDGVRDIVRNNGGTWQYNSAAEGWALSLASYVQSFSLASQDTFPASVAFKPDGTKMYVVGSTGDDVNEYSLSTAWDVSTASYAQNFSVASEESGPYGIFFKSDGTKMYICGSSGQDVNEYNLSTAWDISTASYNQNFSVAAQETFPWGLFFKPDGLKMYIVGIAGDALYEYDLSTAWDVSTASYSQNFSLGLDGRSIFFKPDGLKMYVVENDAYTMREYDLSTAWDISTASYSQDFSVASQVTAISGATFKADGNKMYIVGYGTDSILEYDIGGGFTTSTTWNNGTTNDEFATLAEALGATAVNQMDKTQIDGITDGSHFTLGDTLDLAIVPYLGSAGTAPTSDGVSINYDADALNKGAILGTDYDYDVPAGDKVRITSLSAQNLKVRIV